MSPSEATCHSRGVGFVYPSSPILTSYRAREEELIYVLRKLLELRLWPESLWAALSDNPSQFCLEQPGRGHILPNGIFLIAFYPALGTNNSLPQTPKELIADSIKRTTVAHLFHFYPLITELASIPRESPSFWVQNGNAPSVTDGSVQDVSGQGGSNVVELDARTLARSCLKEIGREMGLPS